MEYQLEVRVYLTIVERCFAIISKKFKTSAAQKGKDLRNVKATETQVYVTATEGLLPNRMSICKILWDANIKCEFTMKNSPKLVKDLSHCEQNKIPLVVIIKPDEILNGVVNVKKLIDQTQQTVKIDELCEHIKRNLAELERCDVDGWGDQTL